MNDGPLTFSAKTEEELIKMASDQTAIDDSKWQAGIDQAKWPFWTILSGLDWNYALILDDRHPSEYFSLEKRGWLKDNDPFSLESASLILRANGRLLSEWPLDQHGLCVELPESPVATNYPVAEVEPGPMGAARLRLNAFYLSIENKLK